MSTQRFEARAVAPRVWPVGALVRAVGDAVATHFNPVAVRGEVSGFKRASSGHCYFSIKDDHGQLRCALFRRSANLLDFVPSDGDEIEARGRLAVYEVRGDLQLVVESLVRAGQGALFEAFLRLKTKLQAEGLFDVERKRPLPLFPRGVGVVTSLQAAALHDVLSTLARRAPQVRVTLAPAAVQGAQAPAQLRQALQRLQARAAHPSLPIDAIVLVRGGGSMEDLWAFNDEQLARVIAASPVPVVVGVGHETDFTIADFVADLRAPTPTAAAELVCLPRQQQVALLDAARMRLAQLVRRRLEAEAQRLDGCASRLGRPSSFVAGERLRIVRNGARLQQAGGGFLQGQRAALTALAGRLQRALAPAVAQADAGRVRASQQFVTSFEHQLRQHRLRLERAELRLSLLDPHLVLRRGYAWLQDGQGRPMTRAAHAEKGERLTAHMADGRLHVTVSGRDLS